MKFAIEKSFFCLLSDTSSISYAGEKFAKLNIALHIELITVILTCKMTMQKHTQTDMCEFFSKYKRIIHL